MWWYELPDLLAIPTVVSLDMDGSRKGLRLGVGEIRLAIDGGLQLAKPTLVTLKRLGFVQG
jgi:hypothetical protein